MALFRFSCVLGLLLFSFFNSSLKAQWSVTGGLYNIYEYSPEYSTGLSMIYIIYGDNNMSLGYTSAESGVEMKCFRYSTTAVEGQEVITEQSGSYVSIVNPEAGHGYYIEENGIRKSYIWIIDYKNFELKLNSLTYDPDGSDCETARLELDRQAEAITYYSINGRRYEISREMELSYNTLKANEESFDFESIIAEEKTVPNRYITVTAPLCNTTFTISGDQFLKYWNIEESVTSDEVEAVAVDGMAKAEMEEREAGNEIDKVTSDFGGSAPINMTFYGMANYPVTTYQAWELSKDSEFGIIEATYTDQDFSYSFIEEGKTYVRYVISNANATCEKVVNTFTIDCSESSLEIPNVFTPDSPSGNNTEFKVAYKSIIKFKGWIFNRWGNQIFHWTDPAQGWDGKHNGKLVPTGAYYYVIEAEGVGGRKYKRKGDINVIRTKE